METGTFVLVLVPCGKSIASFNQHEEELYCLAMNEKEYSQIIARLRVSDQQAFSEVYKLHWKALYQYALQKIGNNDDATDIVQNLFTDLWDNRRKLPNIYVDIKYYLKGILMHQIAQYFKKKGIHSKHEESFSQFLLKHQEQNTDNEQQQHQLESVIKEIDGLPEKMRNIFLLSCTRKYTIVEIATLLNVAPQTVKNQISAALFRIRKATNNYSGDTTHIFLIILIILASFLFEQVYLGYFR